MSNELTTKLPFTNEMIVRDASHPRALLNLVPEAVARAISLLPEAYIDCGEEELLKLFEERKHKVRILDERLRFMFWREYDSAQTNVRHMVLTHVYAGVCSRDSFYRLLQDKERVAWLLCPPVDYMIAAEEALTYGMNQLRDILASPHTSFTGVVDSKAAQVKLEIVKMLDARVKGAIVQTTRNLNLHVSKKDSQQQQQLLPKIEDVDSRIKELESLIANLNHSGVSSTLKDIEVTGEPS